VEDIEIDIVKLEPCKRVMQVRCNVPRGDTIPVGIEMRALGDDDYPFPNAPRVHPTPDSALIVAAAVYVGRVEGIASRLEDPVEQLEAIVQVGRSDHRSALDKPRDGLFYSWYGTIFHFHLSSGGTGPDSSHPPGAACVLLAAGG